jgi:hypothetical protein
VHGPCAAAGIPLVVHFHGYDAYRRDRVEPLAQAYVAMFAGAAAIVAVSTDMVDALVALGAPRERIVLNPCGADLELFRGAAPARARPLFVGVGRFVEKKAQHRTLEAFRRTRDAVPDARLVLVGDGERLDSCRSLARDLGIADAVAFTGRLPQAAIAELLRTARCFVQHSVRAPSGDAEGTPVAILEAGASGPPGRRHPARRNSRRRPGRRDRPARRRARRRRHGDRDDPHGARAGARRAPRRCRAATRRREILARCEHRAPARRPRSGGLRRAHRIVVARATSPRGDVAPRSR